MLNALEDSIVRMLDLILISPKCIRQFMNFWISGNATSQ